MLDHSYKELPNRVALVHEWFAPNSVGGAEQVVQAIDNICTKLGITPQLTALVDGESDLSKSWLYKRTVKTSIIQKLPFGKTHVQHYLPLLPYAIEQIDLTDYPLIISSNHLVAKGVITSPDQLHISYIHTPVRYAWDQMHIYLKRSSLANTGFGPLIRWQLHHLRQWDQLTAVRVNRLIANSRFTSRRIFKFWGRESDVLHPPVDVNRFKCDKPRDEYYLCLCRLVPNKRVDIVVKAFNRLSLPLIVVGDGPEMNYLKRIAGPTVQFLGHQSRRKVEDLMSSCRAFVYAGIEDFGIAPVEAMAAGSPVIGLARGGLLDTIRCVSRNISSPTGLLFRDQTVESLVEAVTWFHDSSLWHQFDSESIRLWADQFSPERFSVRFERILFRAWNEHLNDCAQSSTDPAEQLGLNL